MCSAARSSWCISLHPKWTGLCFYQFGEFTWTLFSYLQDIHICLYYCLILQNKVIHLDNNNIMLSLKKQLPFSILFSKTDSWNWILLIKFYGIQESMLSVRIGIVTECKNSNRKNWINDVFLCKETVINLNHSIHHTMGCNCI